MLSASVDKSRKACRRRPHLSDGFFAGPGNSTDRLHQHQGRSLTQPPTTDEASLSTAPSGKTPVLRKRHSAMSNLRAPPTPSPPPKRADTNHAAPCRADNGANSRPTPWSSSARDDSPTWGCRVLEHSHRCETVLASRPRSHPLRDDACNALQATNALTTTHDPLLPMPRRCIH